MMRGLRLSSIVLAGAVAVAGAHSGGGSQGHRYGVEYDGQITFVRLRWGGTSAAFAAAARHGTTTTPRAEQHLSMIVNELTLVEHAHATPA